MPNAPVAATVVSGCHGRVIEYCRVIVEQLIHEQE